MNPYYDTERERQDSLHGPRSIASPDVSDLFRLAVTTCDWTAEAAEVHTDAARRLRAALDEEPQP